MARLLVSRPHASHADHRRADHKRCSQATRSTKANDGHDEEEITQNRDGTRHVGFQRQRRFCSHGGCYQGASTTRGSPNELTTRKFAEAATAKEAYPDTIRRTLEKTEKLERHVKTVTMRADSLAFVNADFFQTLIERQEQTIPELNSLYDHLCLPLPHYRRPDIGLFTVLN